MMRTLFERGNAGTHPGLVDGILGRVATRLADALAARLEPVLAAAVERELDRHLHRAPIKPRTSRCVDGGIPSSANSRDAAAHSPPQAVSSAPCGAATERTQGPCLVVSVPRSSCDSLHAATHAQRAPAPCPVTVRSSGILEQHGGSA
jgi:hypothetical protein